MADLPIDKPPSLSSPQITETPNDDDMGFVDPENILFISMQSEGLPERFRERIQEQEQMLLLTHQLATIHCGIQVKRRKEEGKLPSDASDDSAWKRNAYRAKVLQTYLQDGIYPWIVSPGGFTNQGQISVEKHRFHWDLLSRMLTGIVLPRPIASSLETVFQSISKAVKGAKFTSATKQFFGVLQVFTYDEIRDDVRSSFRTIDYTVDKDMQTIVETKNTQSVVNVNFGFSQADLAFNERTWSSLKSEVENYINGTGIGNIRDPPTVPV